MSGSEMGLSGTEWLMRAVEMTDPCGLPPAPGGMASGDVGRSSRPSCRGGIKGLRDVRRYVYCSARRLALVETRDHPSRNGEQNRGGGVFRSEIVLKGPSTLCFYDGQKEVPLQYLHYQAEQRDEAVREALIS